MAERQHYVVEYDENSCAWLIHLVTQRRIALEHGMLLCVEVITPPRYLEAFTPAARLLRERAAKREESEHG